MSLQKHWRMGHFAGRKFPDFDSCFFCGLICSYNYIFLLILNPNFNITFSVSCEVLRSYSFSSSGSWL